MVKTNCKSWRCASCRERLKAVFRLKVSVGCYHLGRCGFISVTYKAEYGERFDVGRVSKDWKALWRLMRMNRERSLKWLKVTEVTKRRTPHHHLVMGTIPDGQEVSCYGRGFDVRRYRKRFDTCECLSHSIARPWYQVTGNSYIVHGVAVSSSEGAGQYMAKYLAKTFSQAERMAELGVNRRWSTSRGWPGNGKLELAQKAWVSHRFELGHLDVSRLGASSDRVLERVGDLRREEAQNKATKEQKVKKIRRLVHVDTDVREA